MFFLLTCLFLSKNQAKGHVNRSFLWHGKSCNLKYRMRDLVGQHSVLFDTWADYLVTETRNVVGTCV